MHGTLEGGDAEDGGDEQSVNEGNAFPQWYVVLSSSYRVCTFNHLENSLVTLPASFASLFQIIAACKAHEEIDYSGYRSYNAMPLERDMISLKNGLHLCSLGTVWTKKDGFFGGDHVLLGTASAMAGVREELMEKKAVTERELKAVAFDGLRPFE